MDTCTEEQRVCIEFVLNGESVFITGPGGTGKSYILDVLYSLVAIQYFSSSQECGECILS